MSVKLTKMEDYHWQHVRRFKPEEFEYPDRMDHLAVMMLDSMVVQESVKMPGLRCIVHKPGGDFRAGDTGDHGNGTAIDCHFETADGTVLPVKKQFFMALRYYWTAIGFYPYWNRPGLHMARRHLKIWERRAFWWRDQKNQYRGIEEYFAIG